ncbi:hypothetical protein COLO4_29368 [Corchorus olitorius]|uniref:Uncharacterized protein n=1 Tax=Corchorus olitorius TaxID=93759 RepID=A0A1R3HET9_9ROSI|nr:hypothetical protein COLO4_29368 [Corchorus olitorius]
MAMEVESIRHIPSVEEDDSNVAINCIGNKEIVIKGACVNELSDVMVSESRNVLENVKAIDDSRLRDLDEEIVEIYVPPFYSEEEYEDASTIANE